MALRVGIARGTGRVTTIVGAPARMYGRWPTVRPGRATTLERGSTLGAVLRSPSAGTGRPRSRDSVESGGPRLMRALTAPKPIIRVLLTLEVRAHTDAATCAGTRVGLRRNSSVDSAKRHALRTPIECGGG